LTSGLSDVVDTLRQGSEADSAAVLKSIRKTESSRAAASTMTAATALMMAATPANHTGHRSYGHGGSQAFSRPVNHRLTSPLRTPLVLAFRVELMKCSMEHPNYIFETRYSYAKDRYIDENIFFDLPALELNLARWTTVSNDNNLLNHIITLFWTWDNAVERMIYRPLLEEDLAQADPNDDGVETHTYCSRFLVNALLALACVSFFSLSGILSLLTTLVLLSRACGL
jgi:hypothetical protein